MTYNTDASDLRFTQTTVASVPSDAYSEVDGDDDLTEAFHTPSAEKAGLPHPFTTTPASPKADVATGASSEREASVAESEISSALKNNSRMKSSGFSKTGTSSGVLVSDSLDSTFEEGQFETPRGGKSSPFSTSASLNFVATGATTGAAHAVHASGSFPSDSSQRVASDQEPSTPRGMMHMHQKLAAEGTPGQLVKAVREASRARAAKTGTYESSGKALIVARTVQSYTRSQQFVSLGNSSFKSIASELLYIATVMFSLVPIYREIPESLGLIVRVLI